MASATLDDQLADLGHRLVREHVEIPAGAVLRCVARSANHARTWGCPVEHLVGTVEASSRWRLAQLTSGSTGPRPERRTSSSTVPGLHSPRPARALRG